MCKKIRNSICSRVCDLFDVLDVNVKGASNASNALYFPILLYSYSVPTSHIVLVRQTARRLNEFLRRIIFADTQNVCESEGLFDSSLQFKSHIIVDFSLMETVC